jgi:nucleotide-binding universal stress UspA family protein
MSGRIVVGVDGSETAKLAVRWAALEARTRGATLELVSAWMLPNTAYAYRNMTVSEELVKALTMNAEALLADALEEVRGEWSQAGVETRAIEGEPARVLLDASRDADLLVVGSRGLGGFRELLLGSVSQQCAHHSSCPVVIVRHLTRQSS